MENYEESGSYDEESQGPLKTGDTLIRRISIDSQINSKITNRVDYALLQEVYEKTYRKNQIIVTFQTKNGKVDEKHIEKVKHFFHKHGVKNIKIQKCDNCELPVQLWSAEGIEVVVAGVRAGTGGNPNLVGESYSLNFLSNIPANNWGQSDHLLTVGKSVRSNRAVKIAVLDTGIDPFIVDKGYTSDDLQNTDECECYKDYVSEGWNFFANNRDIEDDDPARHGSLVTQFIINEFKNVADRTLTIIPVKTHDKDGQSDLFKIYCAIYYAIAKGANIINASWGFYYYDDLPIEPLNSVITTLKEKGVLFVTAAGNKLSVQDDSFAAAICRLRNHFNPLPFQLRDLALHQFLPANLSQENTNVITVTTTNGLGVAFTENHSNVFVDLGVIADETDADNDLSFKVPFKQTGGGPPATVKGSSFATAIATGVIGANCDLNLYAHNLINKESFISELIEKRVGQIFPDLQSELVKNGVCIRK
ncbi:MAG TPA: S8 family serine peptidase [Mucilaginibacter sp.]|jgi:hypothetical protein